MLVAECTVEFVYFGFDLGPDVAVDIVCHEGVHYVLELADL